VNTEETASATPPVETLAAELAPIVDQFATLVAFRVAERIGRTPTSDDRPLLSLSEVGGRLGIAERSARALVARESGRGPRLRSVLVGGARRVEPAELDAYIASLRSAEQPTS